MNRFTVPIWAFSIVALLAGAAFFAWAQYDLSSSFWDNKAAEFSRAGQTDLMRLDLSAQNSMATSARAMLGASVIQIALGLVGTFALVATLVSTNESFKATREGLRITRLVSEAQMRPYVGFLEVTNEPEDEGVVIGIRVKNSGTTPAMNVRIYTSLDYKSSNENSFKPIIPDNIDFIRDRDIQPNGTSSRKWKVQKNLVEASVKPGGASIHHVFILLYDDLFAKTHSCLFCVARYGPQFKTFNVFIPADEILHPGLPRSDLRIALDEQKPARFRYRWRWPAVRERMTG